MQGCLELLGQNFIEFWPVRCCPKSIKTKLRRIFSYTMLSGAYWTTSHRILTCAMLSGPSRTTLHRVFTCAMSFGAYCTTLHRVFICPILSQEYLLHRKNISQEKLYVVLSLRLQTTLHKKKSYSMLS